MHAAVLSENQKELTEYIQHKEAPIHYIEEKTGNNTLLHEAALHNKKPWITKILICNGARINQQNIKAQTALHIASQKKNKLMVLYLLFCCREIDWSIIDHQGYTPLHHWIGNEWFSLVWELLQAGYTLNNLKYT